MGQKNQYGYHSGWANLAAAILLSGKRANDRFFLESEWADMLRDMCALDDEMYAARSNMLPHQSYHKQDIGGQS